MPRQGGDSRGDRPGHGPPDDTPRILDATPGAGLKLAENGAIAEDRTVTTMYEADSGELSIALVGDCLVTRRLAVFREARFLRLREILAAADATFANFESNVHRYLDRPQYQQDGAGTYVTTEPALLDDLKWLGINLVAACSNHADDYGWEGILGTMRHLDAAGLVHAGLGRHLAEARAAGLPGHRPRPRGPGRRDRDLPSRRPRGRTAARHAGHPGVNGIRYQTVYEVDRETLARSAADRRADRPGDVPRAPPRPGRPGAPAGRGRGYDFLGQRFVVGPEARCAPTRIPRRRGVLRQVRRPAAMADRVIVSLHCHEQGGPTLLTARKRSEVEDLADFAVDLARRAVDAGADVFVGHGPQVPLGIEIYQGRPIFYGLGAFIFEIETLRFLAEETYERYGLGERATPADFVQTRYANDTRGHPPSAGSGSNSSPSATSPARTRGGPALPGRAGLRQAPLAARPPRARRARRGRAHRRPGRAPLAQVRHHGSLPRWDRRDPPLSARAPAHGGA